MSKMQPVYFDFVFGPADTVLTKVVSHNGYITDIILINPTNTNSVTATLAIQDDEGTELWNSTAKNANTSNHFPTDMAPDVADIPVDDNFKMVVILSGAPGGTGSTVKVKLYIKAHGRR
jgi:hypothetical protein